MRLSIGNRKRILEEMDCAHASFRYAADLLPDGSSYLYAERMIGSALRSMEMAMDAIREIKGRDMVR